MKKSLLALAVLGAYAGVAGAQTAAPAPSTVTLYGIVDAGVRRDDPKTGAADPTTGVTSGNRNGSRFGMRGSEDVGGGNRVIFTIEGGFNIDNGTSAQGGRLFGRQAYVGLAGGWGEVRLGRQMSAGYDYNGALDPFGEGYNDAGIQSIFSAEDYARWDNVLEYRTPVVAGFQAQVGVSSNVGTTATAGAEVPRTGNNPWGYMAGVLYSNGPIVAAATYESFNCPDNTATVLSVAPGSANQGLTCSTIQKANQQEWTVGATYDLKFLKIHGLYGRERGVYQAAMTTIGGTDQFTPLVTRSINTPQSSNWMAGVTVPIGPGRLLGSYLNRSDTTTGRSKAFENNLQIYSVGYEYDLSKRTILYAVASDTNGKDHLNDGYAFDRYQYTVGMRHTF